MEYIINPEDQPELGASGGVPTSKVEEIVKPVGRPHGPSSSEVATRLSERFQFLASDWQQLKSMVDPNDIEACPSIGETGRRGAADVWSI